MENHLGVSTHTLIRSPTIHVSRKKFSRIVFKWLTQHSNVNESIKSGSAFINWSCMKRSVCIQFETMHRIVCVVSSTFPYESIAGMEWRKCSWYGNARHIRKIVLFCNGRGTSTTHILDRSQITVFLIISLVVLESDKTIRMNATNERFRMP